MHSLKSGIQVKPAKFEYHAVDSLEEAVSLLSQYAGEARLLAGGQSLIPMMNFRLAAPRALVDLNRVPGLQAIREEDGVIRIGAMARQRAIEFSECVRRLLPPLSAAVKLVGHLPTRTRGTIGGSIAHADPAAELPMMLRLLDGEVVARGSRGERVIRAADLFQSIFTTSLAADEVLVEVRLPAMPAGSGHAVEEFARRHGDFAIAAVAAVLVREGDRCVSARLATAGTGPVPVRLRAAESLLERNGLDDAVIDEAAEMAARSVEPMSDQNASAEFRRHLTRVLAGRVIHRAAAGHGRAP
jgi:carbon-monoxide dehydrogenase medium subunit